MEVEVPQAVLDLPVTADQAALGQLVEALHRAHLVADAVDRHPALLDELVAGGGLAELCPDPLEDLGQPVMVAQGQLAGAFVHLLAQPGEQEVDLVQPLGGPGTAGVGVEVEADELGEDLLVVILHSSEELAQQVRRDFGILFVERTDELREPAVDRLQPVTDPLALGGVQALRDLLQSGVEVLEFRGVLIFHALEERLAQALEELMEGPARPEPVRDVGVAAMKDAQFLDGSHRHPCRMVFDRTLKDRTLNARTLNRTLTILQTILRQAAGKENSACAS